MTAVRRADVSRSPMLKVMDLFRHRSNSAVSEADKRKAVSFLENSYNSLHRYRATSELQFAYKLLVQLSFLIQVSLETKFRRQIQKCSNSILANAYFFSLRARYYLSKLFICENFV